MGTFWGVLILTQMVSGPADQPEYIVEEFPMFTEEQCIKAIDTADDLIQSEILKALNKGHDVLKEGYTYTLTCEPRG